MPEWVRKWPVTDWYFHVSHTNVEILLQQLLSKPHHSEKETAAKVWEMMSLGMGNIEKKPGDMSLKGTLRAGNLLLSNCYHTVPLKASYWWQMVYVGSLDQELWTHLVEQMRHSNASYWALLVGGNSSSMCCYGLVPDVDTLSLICTARNVCVMTMENRMEIHMMMSWVDHVITLMGHCSIMMWSFQLTKHYGYQSDGDKKVYMFQGVTCLEGCRHHCTTTMAIPFFEYRG